MDALRAYEILDTLPETAFVRLAKYKQAKYVTMIELVETLSGTAGGKGGYWEDDHGYEWYTGI